MTLSPEAFKRVEEELADSDKKDFLCFEDLADSIIQNMDDDGIGFADSDVYEMVEGWWEACGEEDAENEENEANEAKAIEIEKMACAIARKMDAFRSKNTSDINGEWRTKTAEKQYRAMERQLAKLDADLDKYL